jgi:hypothetical protein
MTKKSPSQESIIKKLKKDISNELEVADATYANGSSIYYYTVDEEGDGDLGGFVGFTLYTSKTIEHDINVREAGNGYSHINGVVSLRSLIDTFEYRIENSDFDDVSKEDAVMSLAIMRGLKSVSVHADGFWFETEAQAKKAKNLAVDALLKYRHPNLEQPLPEWAVKAISEGWTAPPGWTP